MSSTKSYMKFFAIIFGSIIVTSCTVYKDELVPPTSTSGMACVSQCNVSKQSCQVSQQALAQQCEANHNRAMNDYQICKAKNPATSFCKSYRTKTETINGQTVTRQECSVTSFESPCKEPVKTCKSSADFSSCDSAFKSCFASCGGVINRVEIK